MFNKSKKNPSSNRIPKKNIFTYKITQKNTIIYKITYKKILSNIILKITQRYFKLLDLIYF